MLFIILYSCRLAFEINRKPIFGMILSSLLLAVFDQSLGSEALVSWSLYSYISGLVPDSFSPFPSSFLLNFGPVHPVLRPAPVFASICLHCNGRLIFGARKDSLCDITPLCSYSSFSLSFFLSFSFLLRLTSTSFHIDFQDDFLN